MAVNTEEIRIPVLPDGRMTAVSAALFLGLSPKTLAMMRSEGTGPRFVKYGRIFYFRDDLDMWLREQPRVRSTSEQRMRASAKVA